MSRVERGLSRLRPRPESGILWVVAGEDRRRPAKTGRSRCRSHARIGALARRRHRPVLVALGSIKMSSSAPKVQDGAWRDGPVAERPNAPIAAAASAGPNYVVTVEDEESEEQAKQQKEQKQQKKMDYCCCACCGMGCEAGAIFGELMR